MKDVFEKNELTSSEIDLEHEEEDEALWDAYEEENHSSRMVRKPAKKVKPKACPQCGKANPPGTKICERCGLKLEGALVRCVECGEPLLPKSKICPSCGRKN